MESLQTLISFDLPVRLRKPVPATTSCLVAALLLSLEMVGMGTIEMVRVSAVISEAEALAAFKSVTAVDAML